MNPASILRDFFLAVHRGDGKVVDVYMKALDSGNMYELYARLAIMQRHAETVERALRASGAEDGYDEFFAWTAELTAPVCLDAGVGPVRAKADKCAMMLLVLKDAFRGTYLDERDVSDALAGVEEEIDAFLRRIPSLPFDDGQKALMARVAYRLKEAVGLYRFTGISGVEEALAAFRCMAQVDEGAKGIVERIARVAETARNLKEIAGFITDGALMLLR